MINTNSKTNKTMKTTSKLILILAVSVLAASFTTTIKKKIDLNESSITWTGKKILGSHTGTIQLQEGYLEMDGSELVGGMFVVDMTTIVVTDLEAGKGKEKLEGHLKSDDFFGIANHPTATLTIKSATRDGSSYEVMGDLTIKGVTQSVTFDMDMGANAAIASIKIDRTKYGVKYGSGSFSDNLGDKAISNKFSLDVSLKF